MNLIRAIRMRLMLVCSRCENSKDNVVPRPSLKNDGYYCHRKQCLEHFEKIDCIQREFVKSLSVRGMICCKFEERKDNGDGAD